VRTIYALDGNAIAGDLFEVFGEEMTSVSGACRHCGAQSRIAELRVYVRSPGAVARCPACQQVVLVLVGVRGTIRLDSAGFGLER
jgi:hypothetical protein